MSARPLPAASSTRVSNPRVLRYIASSDVASDTYQALGGGGGHLVEYGGLANLGGAMAGGAMAGGGRGAAPLSVAGGGGGDLGSAAYNRKDKRRGSGRRHW